MPIYNSFYDFMQESEASDAYKKRKADEKKASDKQERDRAFRKGAALDSEWGGGRKSEREASKRMKNLGKMNSGLKQKMKDGEAGKLSKKDAYDAGLSTMRAMDAKDRHDRRHATKESYGIFSSLIEEQIDDPDLGDGKDDLGMGDRDFGDNMEPDVMMGENGVYFI